MRDRRVVHLLRHIQAILDKDPIALSRGKLDIDLMYSKSLSKDIFLVAYRVPGQPAFHVASGLKTALKDIQREALRSVSVAYQKKAGRMPKW